MIALRTQIASLAIGISVCAALIAAFVPDLLYQLRDYMFIASLPPTEQAELRALTETYGSCSSVVRAFESERGIERWRLNYKVALAVLIALTALLGGAIALKLAGTIAAPIVKLSHAARSIAGGARDPHLLPERRGPREIRGLIGNFTEMAESLSAADRDLRLRSSGIAHELRTPLAVMRARLIGVKDNLFPVDKALIDGMLGQVALIERLASDLTLLCDTQGIGFALERAPTSIDDVVDAVLYGLAQMAAEHGIRIRKHTGTALLVDADPARLERAISNLVENAIRHSGGREVDIAVERCGQSCRIVVDDDGRGWSTEDPYPLVEPFVTGESRARATSKRTGLGLAIVQAIARAHHGTLALETSPAGGARSVLSIPLSAG